MKVEITKLRLAVKALSGNVCVGIPDKNNQSFTHEHDVTNDFRKAVVEAFGGFETVINAPAFEFDHPYSAKNEEERKQWAIEFAQNAVVKQYGIGHVADLDWDNCTVSDD